MHGVLGVVAVLTIELGTGSGGFFRSGTNPRLHRRPVLLLAGHPDEALCLPGTQGSSPWAKVAPEEGLEPPT